MKILSKIKKIIISIGIAMISLPKKIFAFDYNLLNEEMIAVQPAYGVPSPKNSIWYSIWSIAKVTLIPLALIIGLIIYFKKSKSSVKKKIFVTIIVIIITVTIYIIENIIHDEFL